MTPIRDQNHEVVKWNEKEYSWFDFYTIHEDTGRLVSILERHPENMNQEALAAFLLRITQSLGSYVIDISNEAFVEVFYVSLNIQRFLNEQEKRSREDALLHLSNIRKLLFLDELFGKVESNGSVGSEA